MRALARTAALVIGLGMVVVILGGLFAWQEYRRYASDLPTVDKLREYDPPVTTRVYAADDRMVSELATQRRIFVPYSAIPDVVKQAFVSAEDKTFWTHPGVDPLAILRAGVTDLENLGDKRRPIGASTITQQVAKNMLLGSNAVSLSRKVKEAILAMRIESVLSKQKILELYLNEIYLGLGAYGIAAASQTYFNKPLDQLDIAQAAFLGALPKAPNNYNPFRFPEAAKARRDWVIDRMAEDHAITAAEATAAKAEPIDPVGYHRPDAVPGADWFSEEVRRELVDQFGNEAAMEGGLEVMTSLDPKLQRDADRALRDGLMAYDRKHGGWRGPVTQLATGPGLHSDWPAALAQVPTPPGMLADWHLAVVLDVNGEVAQLGWLQTGASGAAPTPRISPAYASDNAWARRGRRWSEVLKPGEVVMTAFAPAASEPDKPVGKSGGKASARLADKRGGKAGTRVAGVAPERLLLRQIPQVQGALVSMDPQTGRVLAMVGGWSFAQSQFNRATQANRQPGSSFKPFVYLTAMEQNISPSQRFLDGPFVLDMGREGQWRPGDYEPGYLGEVPLRIALEKSLNLVTIRLADKIGMDNVAKTAIAFHEVDSMPHVLPAAIGAVETTVLREAGAYASLAMGGREVVPTLIDAVQDRNGNVIWHPQGLDCQGCDDPNQPPRLLDQRAQIADPASVYQVLQMMEGVVKYGTGYAAGKGLNREIAGKTGTTQDFKDAWFAGFTPNLVTVVWVGFDEPKPLGENETGGAIAAPIWHDFMAEALQGRPNLTFPQPPGVTMASWDTGFGTRTDAFKPGQQPGASDPMIASDSHNDTASSGSAPDAATLGVKVQGGTVDSGMGGLY
ncbi:MAG TPA: PBP1A family penicillin-binding protein [Acetobacteraceae bacterium]|nr:PBP1A family penicillin-binding protein [Acetobacteraceae bacterium]